MKAGGFMNSQNKSTSVEIKENILLKIDELIKQQHTMEENLLKCLEINNKVITKKLSKLVENYEILEMQNEVIANEVRNISTKI